MIEAKTEDINIIVKVASFHGIDDKLKKRIINAIFQVVTTIGKESEFIVFRTSIESKG